MRSLAISLALLGCGGSGKPPPPAPSGPPTFPVAGLEGIELGDPMLDVIAVFPTAEPEGTDLWIEGVTIEERPASVGLIFAEGTLRSAAVAFDDPCDQAGAIAAGLDARLGERASSEPGIAAWSHGRWDLALYCATGPTGDYLRLDVRPRAAF